MSEAALGIPMRAHHPALAAAFEQRAQDLAQGLSQEGSTVRRVREALALQFGSGSADMAGTAKRLGCSVATLRRKLLEEEATFSSILDETRR